MQQTLKTSFPKSLNVARREAHPASALRTLDRAALRRMAGGSQQPIETPKGGW